MYCVSCGRKLKFDPMLSTYLSPNMAKLAGRRMVKTDAMLFDVVHCPFCGTKYYVEPLNQRSLWKDRFHSLAFMNNRDGELHLTEESLVFVETYTLRQTVFELRQIFHPTADEQHVSFLYKGDTVPTHILVYEEYGPTWAARIAAAAAKVRESVAGQLSYT